MHRTARVATAGVATAGVAPRPKRPVRAAPTAPCG